MNEQLPQITPTKEVTKRRELVTDRQELMQEKMGYYEGLKESIQSVFGMQEIPEDIQHEMIEIRRSIRQAIVETEYLDVLDVSVGTRIASLAQKILDYQTGEQSLNDVSHRQEQQGDLVESLTLYFDSYRLAHNADSFRKNVGKVEGAVVAEHAARSLNFYAQDEKQSVVVERVFAKYQSAGFTQEEIAELIETCHLGRLDQLEIRDIKIIEKIGDIFNRFMGGDKTRYVGLSAGLMVAAMVEGYAPAVFLDAFQKDGVDLTQVGLFAMLTSAAAGGSIFLQKKFKEFLDKNFSKQGGFGEHVAEGVTEFPGSEVGSFGMERIKRRVAESLSSYERILRKISFDILPAVVTLTTSAAVLYSRSPVLAAGTVAGTGMVMAIDHFVNKKGKISDKRRRAKEEAERVSQKLAELLNAHMEVILSGEKDRFFVEIDELLSRERVALSDKTFMGVVRDRVSEMTQMLNVVIMALATYYAGGSTDKFIAALMYSGRFNEGIATLLTAKQDLLESLRDIIQMEVMFNGYAAEEKEREANRVGMSQLANHDIHLRDVGVAFNGREVLSSITADIPEGEFVSLEGISGSGKTTLLKVLAGYYQPTSGEVQLGGRNMDEIKRSGDDSVYSKIAYLSQFPYILDGDVRSNLRFGIQGEVTDTDIREVLREVGLSKRFSNLGEQLVGGRGDSGTTSGGETARIGLARTLLKIRKNGSKIVFLDEPTASVDDVTAEYIADVLNREKQRNPEVTFIAISHNKEFRDKLSTSRVIKIANGKVEA